MGGGHKQFIKRAYSDTSRHPVISSPFKHQVKYRENDGKPDKKHERNTWEKERKDDDATDDDEQEQPPSQQGTTAKRSKFFSSFLINSGTASNPENACICKEKNDVVADSRNNLIGVKHDPFCKNRDKGEKK